MVKTPRTRHSKPQRAPVTIDLDANAPAGPSQPEPAVDKTPTLLDAAETVAAEPPLEQPVEDRIEDEAATTGRPSTYRPEPARPATPDQDIDAGGWGSHLAAGLFGGALVAGAAWFFLPGQPAPDTTAIDGVRSQLAALQSEVEGIRSAGGTDEALAGSVRQLRDELTALQSAVQANANGGEAVGPLNDRIAQLETAIGSLSAANEQSGAQEQRLAALEQSLAALTGKVDSQTAQPKIALAIATAALKSALERGAPFSAELETFAAIAPASPQLDALRPYAQAGVPARSDITKAFPAAANAMVAAANPVDENAGFFQRLLTSAEQVVQVRPVGEVPGDEPAARIARMEVAINAGDYARALAEYDALPDVAKAAGASVVDQVRTRLEVEQLADRMIADAMKGA